MPADTCLSAEITRPHTPGVLFVCSPLAFRGSTSSSAPMNYCSIRLFLTSPSCQSLPHLTKEAFLTPISGHLETKRCTASLCRCSSSPPLPLPGVTTDQHLLSSLEKWIVQKLTYNNIYDLNFTFKNHTQEYEECTLNCAHAGTDGLSPRAHHRGKY